MNNTILFSFEVCHDTDNGATDDRGDGCDWYSTAYEVIPTYLCGAYDDDDFISNQMCCACAGGTSGNIPGIL